MAASHFNWLQMIPGVEHETIHVATAIGVTGLLIVLSLAGRVALGSGEASIVPAGRLSIKGIFEMLIEFVSNLTENVLGKGNDKYVPLFASIFFFILVNNLIGLIPGMTPATDNINTTYGIGIFSFLVYNYIGIRERGLHYYEDFTGHLPVSFFLMWPLMIVIELLSHLARPLSLGLRLAGNITGDHAVLGSFLELVPKPLVYFSLFPLYGLGLMVCFLQAFVFTLLSMTYVMMAQPQEDH